MLAKLSIKLKGANLNNNMSSLFHGYLMSIIDSDYAEYLHYNMIKPFTSSVFKIDKSGEFVWRITTLNKLAYEKIILKILSDNIKQIEIKQKNMIIDVEGMDLYTTDYDELYNQEDNISRIRLITPTSYKTQGSIQIFPNIATMIKGVINKINEHSDFIKLNDDNIIDELLDCAYIKDYSLRTQNFSLEGIKIKGFIGTIDVFTKKDKLMIDLLNYVLRVSEYTGIGIKTSLGMGVVKIVEGRK